MSGVPSELIHCSVEQRVLARICDVDGLPRRRHAACNALGDGNTYTSGVLGYSEDKLLDDQRTRNGKGGGTREK